MGLSNECSVEVLEFNIVQTIIGTTYSRFVAFIPQKHCANPLLDLDVCVMSFFSLAFFTQPAKQLCVFPTCYHCSLP